MLVAVALAAVPEALHARNAKGSAAQDWERRSAQADSARHARDEQYRRIEREQAHAQMPSTMYASTPDPSTPPHSFPLDGNLAGAPERQVTPAADSVRSTGNGTHRIALFPSAADELGRQGFARVINHSESEGEVHIDAYDDDGDHYGPLTLAIGGKETKHFNSGDLEEGDAKKGLPEGVGSGEGDWRLELSSTLDIEVLSYIRTSDGFLTSMHDMVPRTEAGHRVPIFNPGKNSNQVSRLRLINPGSEPAEVRIEGIDEKGRSPGEAVVFMLEGGASRTLSAKDLESGEGVSSGALGTGEGKWQLVVNSDEPIEVLNTLSTPTGHLTNLSTAPGYAGSDDDDATTTHRIGLFPSAGGRVGASGLCAGHQPLGVGRRGAHRRLRRRRGPLRSADAGHWWEGDEAFQLRGFGRG